MILDEWADWEPPRDWYTISDMTRDHQHNPDPNVNAARIVAESTAAQASAGADIEAAWAEWSSHLQRVDERTLTLLRAAFEAGWDAGRNQSDSR